jgi:2'-5' RNA ligase
VAFNLQLREALRKARWKVKIRDKESREAPHVTIIRGTDAWRINLRTGQFMDANPDPSDVPQEIVDIVQDAETWQSLCDEWDRMYPDNPVSSDDENAE